MHILILGGTTEASALARAVSSRPDIAPVLSFAGRTEHPVRPPIPFRSGGFGGVDGLRAYLAENRIAAVVDATHPFADQMSRHAASACKAEGVPLVVFTRPGWTQGPGDRWTNVQSVEAAVRALGTKPRRIFLTQGRLQLAAFAAAPQHFYLVRSIDAPAEIAALPNHRLILARGPFSLDNELALMRADAIDALVTKNSGGAATYAKIEAAQRLGVEVVMIERPPAGCVETMHDLADVLSWLDAHRAAP